MLGKTVTKEELLERIGEYTIYERYAPAFQLNKAFISPFRNERRPSFIIKVLPTGRLYHVDYADDNYKGGCIDFVMQLYNLSFRQALEKIDNDFSGLGTDIKPIKKVDVTKQVSVPKVIDVEIREFNMLDITYWEMYGINERDLIREEIFSINKYWMDGKEYRVGKELCFGYKFDNGWKIYFPDRKEFKWFSSVPNNQIEGWDNIRDFSYLIITKSRKDRLVLSKVLKNVINAQNESRSLLDDKHKDLFQHFKKVYVFFDADDPGVKACKKITQEMGWNYINTPRNLLPDIKDPAEWVKKEGYEPLKKFLNTKICTK